jgi:hypothetical protein
MGRNHQGEMSLESPQIQWSKPWVRHIQQVLAELGAKNTVRLLNAPQFDEPFYDSTSIDFHHMSVTATWHEDAWSDPMFFWRRGEYDDGIDVNSCGKLWTPLLNRMRTLHGYLANLRTINPMTVPCWGLREAAAFVRCLDWNPPPEYYR